MASLPARMKQYRVSRKVKGQRIQTPFVATAALAQAEFKVLEEKAAGGTRVDAAAARISVEQYAGRWLERREALVAGGALAVETLKNNKVQLRRYILPALQYRPLASLTADEILTWRNSLVTLSGEPLAEASRVKATAVLSMLLADAVDDGILDRSPMRKRSGRAAVPRSKEQEKEHLYLEPRQLLRMSQAIDSEYRLMVLLAGLCGPRISEVLALTGSSVTDAGDLKIEHSLDRAGELKATKTYEGRSVRIPEVIRAEVLALAHSRKRGEPLFQTAGGGTISRTNFRTRAWVPARDAAATAVSTLQDALGATGLRHGVFCERTLERVREDLWGAEEVGPREWRALGLEGHVTRTVLRPGDRDFSGDLTFHDLRHTAASLAISSKASIKAVQEMLGHRTASMTLDLYAGLFESDRVATADGIGELYEAGLAA